MSSQFLTVFGSLVSAAFVLRALSSTNLFFFFPLILVFFRQNKEKMISEIENTFITNVTLHFLFSTILIGEVK